MKESLFKSIISTLLVTILVIWMKIDHRVDNPLESIKVGRNLQTAEGAVAITRAEYTSFCIINGTDLGLVPGFNAEFTSLNAYIKSLDYYDDKFNADISKVIINDESPATLVTKVFGGYILIVIFAIITFISYFACIGCCCRPACCCKSETKQEGWGSFKGISFILTIAGLCGIIIACAIGWTYAREIPDELDVLDCTMMRFYLNFRQGEEKTQVPKWVGLDKLITSFTNIETALDQVFSRSAGNVFQTGVGIVFDTNRVEANKNSYYTLLDRKWTENAGGLARSPNPNVQGTSTPVLISNFGPASNQGSSLNMMRMEYDMLITNTTDVLRSFRETAPNLNNNISTGKAIFRYVTDSLRPFDSELKKFDDDYISFFRARKNDEFKAVKNAFLALFIVVFILNFCFVIFIYLYSEKDMGFMKWLSHILWHLITLLTIPLFILGGAFGLLGTALYYAGPFVEILLSTNGINSFFTNVMARDILNECFNGNAQLRIPLQLNNGTYMPIFDKFYNESYHIEQVALQFQNTRDSPVSQRLNKMYTDAISNVALIQGTSNTAPNIALFELSSYTNYMLNNTKIESCSKRTQDVWVSSQSSCPSDHPFITSASSTARLGDAACLNVREWSAANALSRYSDRPSCGSNLNVAQMAQNYVTAINNYATDAEPLINEIRTDLTDINSEFVRIADSMKANVDSARPIYTPLTDAMKESAGRGGLNDMLDCKFVSRDVAQILFYVQEPASIGISIAACIISVALCNSLILFFGIIYLFRSISSGDENKVLPEENDKKTEVK